MPYKSIDDNRASQRRHYEANKQFYMDRNAVVRAEKREWMNKQKDVPCADCGKKYPPYVMDFDHRDPTKKLFECASLVSAGWKRLREEIAKCDIVCANCHRERTYQQRL